MNPSEKEQAPNPLTPAEAFGLRMREARKSAGLSEKELAERVRAMGFRSPVSRGAVNWLELDTRSRGVTLEEVLAVAAALGVAPINLLTPHVEDDLTTDVRVVVGDLAMPPAALRSWIAGEAPSPFGGFTASELRRFYVDEVPPAVRQEREKAAGEIARDRPREDWKHEWGPRFPIWAWPELFEDEEES